MKHIMVIEDEHNILYLIRVFLMSKGCQVSTANNGAQGMQKIHQAVDNSQPIDLIITDIMLPDINGINIIEAIRNEGLDIPIMAISGYGTKEMLIKLMRLGCVDYLDKPFSSAMLHQRINEIFMKQN